MSNSILKYFYITVFSAILVLAPPLYDTDDAYATGIPVFDGANAAQNALAYIEWLFQHIQMLTDYGIELEEIMQLYLEWEWALERLRGLFEILKPSIIEAVLGGHEKHWG